MWDWLTELFGGGEVMDIGPGIGDLGFGQIDARPQPTIMDVDRTRYDNRPPEPEAGEMGDGLSDTQMMGMGLAGLGLLGSISKGKSQEKMRRSQLRIDNASLDINKTLADGAYRVKRIALSTQFEDLRGQVSQAANKERKLYESSAAKMLVKQAEAGQSGQSSKDVQMTLSRGHEDFQNMLISNAERTETMLLHKGSSLMDEHTAQTAMYNVTKAGLAAGYGNEWDYVIGNLDDYSLSAYMAYLKFTA